MRSEIQATLLALLVGFPLAFLFAGAVAEGEARRREAPLRAMIGNAAFEAIAAGQNPPQGYYGEDRTAPDFTLRDKDGRPWRLSDRRGKKVVVMNFWSITCGPCIEEMPSLDALDRVLRRRYDDVELVTVSTDAGHEAVASALPEGTRMTVHFDPERAIVRGRYGTRLYPETWIIDKRGLIRARVDGARDWSGPLALELIDAFR